MSVTSKIEEEHFSLAKSWFMWACAAMFYGYQFLLRTSPDVMTGDLMEAFSIDGCTLGALTGLYYYGYALLQVPGGTLIDRFGTRRMLTVAALCCAGGTLLFSMATSTYVAGIGRFIIGVGSAGGFLSCLKTGTNMFPPKKLPLIVGLTLSFGILGAMVAGQPLILLINAFGWRMALWIVAGLGVVIAALAWILVDTKPAPELEAYILSHHEPDPEKITVMKGILLIVKSPQSWVLALYGLVLYIPLSGFGDLWAVPFFENKFGLIKEEASFAVKTLYLGLGFGAPCVSWMADRFKSYRINLYIAALVPFIMLTAVIYIPADLMNYHMLLTLLFIAGFFHGSQFLIFTVICDLNPLSVSSIANGFLNMMCMFSGFIIQPLIGKLLDISWQNTFEDGVRVYTTSDFLFAMSTIPLSLLIGALLVPFIREVYPKD